MKLRRYYIKMVRLKGKNTDYGADYLRVRGMSKGYKEMKERIIKKEFERSEKERNEINES